MMATDSSTIAAEIVAASPDAILFSDRDGLIRFWNPGAERLFGYRAADVLGQSLDLIIPARLRQKHWQGYHKVMATGQSGYGQKLLAVPALHLDGSERSVEFSIAMHHDAAGQVTGVSAIMRDVTERFLKEKALRAELAALRDSKETA